VVTRVVAAAIDLAVALIVSIALYLGIAGATFLAHPRRFHFPESGMLPGITMVLVALVVYLTITWTLSGRTYGSQVMGVRATRINGATMSAPIAFARAVLYVVFPIGLLWCPLSRHNRSLQDIVLHTSVRYDWGVHGSAQQMPADPAAEIGDRV